MDSYLITAVDHLLTARGPRETRYWAQEVWPQFLKPYRRILGNLIAVQVVWWGLVLRA